MNTYKKYQVDMTVCVGISASAFAPKDRVSLGMAVEALNPYEAAVIAYRRAVHDFGGSTNKVAVHFVKIEEVEDREESE